MMLLTLSECNSQLGKTEKHLHCENLYVLRTRCYLYVIQTENSELVQQIDNLQKKLSDSEAAVSTASEQYKQLQQENEISVTKLKGAEVIDDSTA